MIQIEFSEPTTAELFPIAHQQDLFKKQAEHFVNKIITNGNFESGYENIPVEFPKSAENLPILINTKPPQLFIVGYIKYHWKPLLLVGVSIAILVTVYHNLKQRKIKQKRKEITKIN